MIRVPFLIQDDTTVTRRAHSLCTPAVTARAAPPRQHPSGTSRMQNPPIRPVRTVILSPRESSFSLAGPAQLQSSSSCTTAAECSCKSIRQWPCSIQASQMARVPQQRSCSKAPLEQLRHWRHAAKRNPSPSSVAGHGAEWRHETGILSLAVWLDRNVRAGTP